MRLARPIYESMPLLYAGIGGFSMLVAYIDPQGPRSVVAFVIGLIAETAALTVFLHRQDSRALRLEYSGRTLEPPAMASR